jgi:hypothetical protein
LLLLGLASFGSALLSELALVLFKHPKRADVQTQRYFGLFGRSSRSFERFDQQPLAGDDPSSFGCASGSHNQLRVSAGHPESLFDGLAPNYWAFILPL